MRLLLVMPTGLEVGYDECFSMSPLGLETLAAYARNRADVAIADMRGQGRDAEAHAERLLAGDPDMVGVCLNSAPHTKYVLALGRALKRRRPDLKLIAGGQQATFIVQEVLGPGDFDAVVRGEGERTLSEILERGDWRGVAGVSWREDGRICHAPDRPLIEDLDTALPPARDFLPDRRRYRMGGYRLEGMETSRGCPYTCTFCSVRNFHRGVWRAKSPDRVMEEIDGILERFPPSTLVICFADDNFAHDTGRVIEICKAIAARRSSAYFWCQARVDTLARHPEMAEWLGRAHFAAAVLGIETPVARLQKAARKGVSAEDTQKVIEMLHANDVGVWGTFTLGLPGETREEAEEAVRFAVSSGVDVVQVTVATPIPGSALYEEVRAGGGLADPDWDRFDFGTPLMSGQAPKKEMDALLRRAYLGAYLKAQFFAALLSKRTNLARLRRTALRVFSGFIWYLLKDRVASWFGRRAGRRRAAPPPSAKGDAP